MMQLVHVFENHEHTVCTSKEVKHIHAQELDCDIFHRPYQDLSIVIPSNLEEIRIHYYTTYTEAPKKVPSVFHLNRKSRGPPIVA